MKAWLGAIGRHWRPREVKLTWLVLAPEVYFFVSPRADEFIRLSSVGLFQQNRISGLFEMVVGAQRLGHTLILHYDEADAIGH